MPQVIECEITAVWNPSANASGYRFYIDDVLQTEKQNPNFQITIDLEEGPHDFTVEAFNDAGETRQTITRTIEPLLQPPGDIEGFDVRIRRIAIVQPGDIVPPDPPAAPSVSGFSSNTITLSIPESTAADHSRYELYQSSDGSNYTLIDSSINAPPDSGGALKLVTGLTPSVTYSFYLVDFDNSKNQSQDGAVVSQQTSSPLSSPFDLSPYSVSFSTGVPPWPTPPNIVSEVTTTPGSIGADLQSSRRVILTAGSYGVLALPDDCEFVLQFGAIVERIEYGGTQRAIVRGFTPRSGVIRSMFTSAAATDVLFNAANFEHTPSMTGTTGIRASGTRVSIVNCSARVGGYMPSAFGSVAGAWRDCIVANNHFISDSSVKQTGAGGQSLSRCQEVWRQVWVNNFQENRAEQAGARWHANTFGNEDLHIEDNIFYRSVTGNGVGVSHNPGGGGTTSVVGSDRVWFLNNRIYMVPGSNGAFNYLSANFPDDTNRNEVFQDNIAYGGGGFPPNGGGPATWTVSGNQELAYQAPPSPASKVGFAWQAGA